MEFGGPWGAGIPDEPSIQFNKPGDRRMFDRLKRHPFAIEATLRRTLVLTYAFERALLEPLLSPGLELDTYGDFGFVAIAIVDVGGLRPAGLPKIFGSDQRMVGYRIFVRYRTREGRRLRGLKILRSYSDRPLMVAMGNLLTHYGYRRARIDIDIVGRELRVGIVSSDGEGDLSLVGDLSARPADPPSGSPFRSMHDARMFVGPLPFTFDYERETDSIVRVEGVRSDWFPRPLELRVGTPSFFATPPFAGTTPLLANAFEMTDIPYLWKRGIVEKLEE